MIEYTLAWLESVGVEEVFVFCCAHSQQLKQYLNQSEWTKPAARFSVTTIESHDAISAGDALRIDGLTKIYKKEFALPLAVITDFSIKTFDMVSKMDTSNICLFLVDFWKFLVMFIALAP
ncbi:hypothetical protein BHE74_00041591 [Ensete ventricosum]|uniref:Uncharacterized protein n=1 Tax=Ensete ventricosum TaxID=4639 RepID=A0A426ZQQ7_ENSVE|nr:hypothetical protein B296_00040274 [Ensete ventricosum]RWV91490.1 hypothetical protein GW17_00046218 [Ensete ventricosum]RWW52022.1 hypothetical protein BHE74_00041591 [Ensete ventricosum]RZR98307.1 hypothetical protein BHM03_00027647 [Ensete ventricosum]